MAESKVISRFPPSPTGFLHIGSVRTALFNYLFARQNQGTFVLRIEDTDRERSKKEFEKDIIDGLAWLGINHDNKEIVHQSERGEVYKKYLQQMVDAGKAYVSKEQVTEENQRAEVIRFKNPNKVVTFKDLVRGEVTFDTTELGDFVIAKSMTEPVYHLAVVVDDFEAGVTHVIRGEDGISNTPRQILIQEAIGAGRPIYAHLPLILAEDRSKLSKRKHGERVSLKYYINRGYLKEAIINFVAFLGWNPGDDRELLSMDELIQEFKIEKVQKGGAIFNEEKLKWINREYIRKLSQDAVLLEVQKRLPEVPTPILERAIPAIVDRIFVFGDIDELKKQGEFDYLTKVPEFPIEKLFWKGETDAATTKTHLQKAHEILSTLSDRVSADDVKNAIWGYATDNGRGQVLWPLRYALSGKEKSPDPFILISILGVIESQKRIEQAINKL